MSKEQLGFTVVELLIVIVIVGILAAYVVVKLPVDTVNLSAEAALVANDLRYTQSLSTSRGQRYKFSITSPHTFSILLANTGTPQPLPEGDTVFTLVSTISSNLPNDTIVFGSDGTPFSANNSALPPNPTITLARSSETKTINIKPETGWISP